MTQLLAAFLATNMALNAPMASDAFDPVMDDMALDMLQQFFKT